MIEAIGSRDYAEMNSMKCIVDRLKANDCESERGGDRCGATILRNGILINISEASPNSSRTTVRYF
jgi:hypothetical protein